MQRGEVVLCVLLPSKKHFSDILFSNGTTKWVKGKRRHIYFSDLWDTPRSWLWIRKLHAVSCVLWLALRLVNRRRLFCSSCHTQGKCFSGNGGAPAITLSLLVPRWLSLTEYWYHWEKHKGNVKKQMHCLLWSTLAPILILKLWLYCIVLTLRVVSFNQVKARMPLAGHSSDLSMLLLLRSVWIK